jgi:hypothetical protein
MPTLKERALATGLFPADDHLARNVQVKHSDGKVTPLGDVHLDRLDGLVMKACKRWEGDQ